MWFPKQVFNANFFLAHNKRDSIKSRESVNYDFACESFLVRKAHLETNNTSDRESSKCSQNSNSCNDRRNKNKLM